MERCGECPDQHHSPVHNRLSASVVRPSYPKTETVSTVGLSHRELADRRVQLSQAASLNCYPSTMPHHCRSLLSAESALWTLRAAALWSSHCLLRCLLLQAKVTRGEVGPCRAEVVLLDHRLAASSMTVR